MFTKKTLTFLKELAANNNREWFEANKHRYESEVREPALEYIEQMAPRMAKISPSFVASPKKVGGSLMRVYRDVRFSKDKTPYKTNVGIQFRHVAGKDVHAPGFYLHIEPGEVFLGGGIWKPDSQTLRQTRMQMDENQAGWKKISAALTRKDMQLHGDSLKRPPKGFAEDHPLIEDLKRKDFIALTQLKPADVSSSDFLKRTTAIFTAAAPLIKFICEANDHEF